MHNSFYLTACAHGYSRAAPGKQEPSHGRARTSLSALVFFL